MGDVIALADERIATDKFTLVHPTETWKKTELTNYDVRELQVPVFQGGELVYQEPTIQEKQAYCQEEFETLYPEVTRINMPHEYYVDLTDKLRQLKSDLIALHGGKAQAEKPAVKVKK